MRRGLLVLIALGLCQSGCALRGPGRGVSRDTVIALLPEGGRVGRVNVSNARGDVDLAKAREATRIAANRAPAAATVLDDDEVQRLFGEALSAMPLPPQHLVLQFRFDSEELTAESRALLPEVLRAVRERPAPDVIVVGHTDTTGDRASNERLGMRRADAVRRLLLEAGADPAYLEIASHGEADLLVKTPDETPEPANRRVEITLR